MNNSAGIITMAKELKMKVEISHETFLLFQCSELELEMWLEGLVNSASLVGSISAVLSSPILSVLRCWGMGGRGTG